MNITKGKSKKAKKVVIYGPEGIGKSTFASQFPEPVFIDTEGSTGNLDVARFDAPSSWQMLMDEVEYVIKNPDCCKTLAIDTADWAEQLCITHLCQKYQQASVESFGYGKGYTYVKEEFGRLLNKLSDVIEKGINVVITAHAQMRKFEQPDEMGSYDRWELKLSKQTSSLIKEWCDILLFANYKTYVVKVNGKNKAQGGNRVMYTAHHSCWDAKNRYGLAEELPLLYDNIRSVIEDTQTAQTEDSAETIAPNSSESLIQQPMKQNSASSPAPAPAPAQKESINLPDIRGDDKTITASMAPPGSGAAQQMTLSIDQTPDPGEGWVPVHTDQDRKEVDPRIPKALRDLMIANKVDEWDIQNVVAARGYFPFDVPVAKYAEIEPGFVEGCLVAAWPQVYNMILAMRKEQGIPFN